MKKQNHNDFLNIKTKLTENNDWGRARKHVCLLFLKKIKIPRKIMYLSSLFVIKYRQVLIIKNEINFQTTRGIEGECKLTKKFVSFTLDASAIKFSFYWFGNLLSAIIQIPKIPSD